MCDDLLIFCKMCTQNQVLGYILLPIWAYYYHLGYILNIYLIKLYFRFRLIHHYS